MRQNERASIFGSLRMAVAGICDIVATVGTKSSEVVELTFDSQLEDIKHTYAIKLSDNAKEFMAVGTSPIDISNYLIARGAMLNVASMDNFAEVNNNVKTTTNPTTQTTRASAKAPK